MKTVDIHSEKVIAPQELEISGDMDNEKIIADWWRRARLLIRSMEEIGRVAGVSYDAEENKFYLWTLNPEHVS